MSRLVPVLEFRRVQVHALGLENVGTGQALSFHQIIRCGHVLGVALRLAHLVGVAHVVPRMPLPKGSSIIGRSRLAMTTRPTPTIFLSRIASRMTAKASCPILSVGAM